MSYIDGTILPVPLASKERYKEHAQRWWPFLREHGALSQQEYWSDDLPEGQVNSMHTAVLRKPDEAVVYAFVVWPSKQVRDAAWAKMMKDEGFTSMEMPFDAKRMIFGGFESLLVLEKE